MKKEDTKTEHRIFIVGTVTMALKAKELLNEKKIPAQVRKTQSGGYGVGCGYGVEVTVDRTETVKQLLFAGGIKVMAVEARKP